MVFVTKYRRRVLSDEHLDYLRTVFTAVCANFDAVIVEMDGEDDHVHLLLEYPPTVQLSKLVNNLKGVSSRLLRANYSVRAHHAHPWSPSYVAASAGGAPLSIIRSYIENQRTLL